jgi:transposase
MPTSHRPYSAEFRQRIVELVRKGRTPEDLARQFEPSAQAIRKWVRQADRDDGRRQVGLTTTEQDELRRFRGENRMLREERDILKGAAAWFAPGDRLDPVQGFEFVTAHQAHEETGLTVAEIAAATGSNEEAAKRRLRYAMAKLKAVIDE